MTATTRAPLRVFLILLLGAALSGCGPALNKVVREHPGGGFVSVDAATAGQLVSVTRGGRALDVRLPLMLQPGDIIETGAGGAVLRLDNGEAVLAPRTKVRLGSLEVFFGRVLASVRGLFRVEDESVAADVEGTRFLFESSPGRSMRVVVLDGVVRCSSRQDRWAPMRVAAGRQMTLNYRGARAPVVNPVSEAEMARIDQWAQTIRNAPKAGWCCAGGRVYPALSNACGGHFEESQRTAEYQCTRGWCCAGGQVSASLRAECRGSFHVSQREAVAACTEPTGWCCVNGQVIQTTRSRCAGQFFGNDANAAQRACTPPPAATPPSRTGTVTQPVVPINPNLLRIYQATPVWCCIRGQVSQTNRATCAERGGTAYPDADTARQRCVVIK
ncbi:FecR domain-containing protein [Nitrogeniibacter mangrovi]|uniref:FecR domain-containing protein n=1 Tax=Nitrogeniibacter mangrovi TaxID=2016596 RepID=A0A6C1B688_9RHOO|nr:FecR family protein [Nitrogeniibacter mangrovi]QID19211.1 FecR domain-containing protein [Nitrogeniibacter mangrovi]